MIRKIIGFLICVINLIPAFAQTWDEVKHNNSVYIYGEGWGATVDEADQQALSALISKINVVVSSNFTLMEDEKTTNGSLDANSYTQSKLQTYASATLTNTERIVINSNIDEVCIGRFIKRSELNRIFEGRKLTLKEYLRLGLIAESACKIDDALRNYYWAYSLLKSVQHPAEVVYHNEDTGEKLYPLAWLPERINNILDDMNVEITANDGTNIDLLFTYKESPVRSVDFTYFDGRNWSNISSAKNGRGSMEFSSGLIPENVQINYEYAYRSQAHINQEIKSVLDIIKSQTIRKSRVNINTKKQKGSNSITKQTNRTSNLKVVGNIPNEKTHRQILDQIIAAIKSQSYNDIYSYFTEDGKDMFQKLIMYGNARVLNDKDCELYQYGSDVVARSLQMSFSFKQGLRRNFVEDVVFTFNSEGKIDCLAFGLDEKAKNDIMKRQAWPQEARLAIMEFLENYKTAYALKRIDYLRTIFDDNAVIIVGHVAQRMQKNKSISDGPIVYENNKYIKRTQLSKEQYLQKLEACFNSNEFVNIRFANNEVRKAKIGEEYGIQIKQDYYSSNYGDQGYLYLQVDLNDRKQPIIRVRTWQSEPDPEVGLFGIGHF